MILVLFELDCSVNQITSITLKNDLSPFTHYVRKYGSDEPTKAPVIIKAEFSNVKPIPAAAQPEYEFNIEITTISAPPMGIINKTN